MAADLGPGDVTILAILFTVAVVKGLWVSWKGTGLGICREATATPEAFFLAGRSMEWWAVGLSMFATNIGTEHFVGQAGAAATAGLPVAIYEWTGALLIFFLGWGLAPMYLGLDITTVPEWFERRFSKGCRLLLAFISVVAYVITKIAATLFAGAVLFDVVLEVDMWKSVPVLLVFTALYSAIGGLRAVMYTDASQAIIFILGGIVGAVWALSKIGGVGGLMDSLDESGLAYFTHTLRPMRDLQYPWLGMMIGQPLASVWYWCIDQDMVQRVLAAKSISHAQGGCAIAGYLKLLPPFMMVFPGMIARCFFEKCQNNDPSYADWCDVDLSDGEHANKAYPLLIVRTFPDGLRGLMIVSMVLAMMSSLDSVFNCASTIFTNDVYKRFINPSASATRTVWVGRGATVVAAAFGIIWLPMIHHNQSGLYLATQSVMAHLSPVIVAVFFLGVLWPRANGQGALAGMAVGFTFGILRFCLNFWATCEEGSGGTFQCMNFNHMALVIFVITVVVTVMVSGWTARPDDSKLWGTCFNGPRGEGPEGSRGEAFKVNAEISKFLQTIGGMLLAITLSLCVGFGYTNRHEQDPNPGSVGCNDATAISGGILAILCNLGVAFVVILWFGLVMWMRRGTLGADMIDTSSSHHYHERGLDKDVMLGSSFQPGPGNPDAQKIDSQNTERSDPAHRFGYSPQPYGEYGYGDGSGQYGGQTMLSAGLGPRVFEKAAQTDMKAIDLETAYGGSFTIYNSKDETDVEQWSVGSDEDLKPPCKPVVIPKPISHVHREMPCL